MKFDNFAAALPEPVFDLAFVRQFFDAANEAGMAVQLSRWEAAGRIVRLRRGLYVLARQQPNTLSLANRIVDPSYISGEYALSYYGLILDAAFEITSACLRAPRRAVVDTRYGIYSYRQVKVYAGFEPVEIDGCAVLIATPEKALVDTWHWLPGRWSRERHEEMRYGNMESIDSDKLRAWALRFSPRLREAAEVFFDLKEEELHAA